MTGPLSRSRLAFAALALALVAAACAESTGGASTTVLNTNGSPQINGPAVPATAFTTFDGAQASLGDFAGQPIVLNFWASWCPSCVAEMSSAFRPAHERFSDDVVFIGMNIQDDRLLANQLLKETGVRWLNAEDPSGELYRELGGIAMPFTVFISASGEIVDLHNGPLNEAQLIDRITEELLG